MSGSTFFCCTPIGFSFLRDKKATVRLAPQTISRFKERVRELTNRTRSESMETRIAHLNRYLMGWLGYFRLASAKSHCERERGPLSKPARQRRKSRRPSRRRGQAAP
ncbi:hypothetical protein GXP70_21490 [Paenibacillus lycopersici]|uniref:Group II intron maturase-specific domain-containing protein n=1 Tax=Paenibacillus lycopersici TaxID=2704462 RepID=A0A6C0G8Q5_9BACL|nr:hypothetical protein GXP70_21490 [Paenibacillus lycopersici]